MRNFSIAVYVSDTYNMNIRKISPAGVVSTIAGDGSRGYKDQFTTTMGIDAKGNLYVADQGNNRIHKITATGVVTTFSGDGNAGR